MIAVYRNIEKFMGINDRAELNADITGVMDRLHHQVQLLKHKLHQMNANSMRLVFRQKIMTKCAKIMKLLQNYQ